MLIVIIVAQLGKSEIAKFIGYEFAMFIGNATWVLMAIMTSERFWIECAILSQVLSIFVAIWHKKRNK